ncbi:MAG: trypsin-like peptidase domain-containing protein [Pseudomonadota bacterium]
MTVPIVLRSWLLLGALIGSSCTSHGGAVQASDPTTGQVTQASNARPLTQSPAEIAARSTPAIVTVRTGDGLGTGFVVRKDGWVATNFHVVRGATAVTVVFSDHREFPVVEIMNANRLHDLVILRIDARDLPVLPLGDSDQVRAGDSVLAIGHPLGLEDTVSNGLISAVRDVHAGLRVLQISAPIAPGSSGGPLFNDRGEVIGVATAISTSGQNLNFGLPSKYVTDLVEHPHPISMELFAAAMLAIQRQASAGRDGRERQRDIPHHELTLLNGCTDANKELIFKTLQDAIEVGAPLYNQGKLAACYHIYEGAAADLAQRLPRSCGGPKHALSLGQHRAAKLSDPGDQAWAMRDSFDGVLELLERSSH